MHSPSKLNRIWFDGNFGAIRPYAPLAHFIKCKIRFNQTKIHINALEKDAKQSE